MISSSSKQSPLYGPLKTPTYNLGIAQHCDCERTKDVSEALLQNCETMWSHYSDEGDLACAYRYARTLLTHVTDG
jgi:hypothetical protein